MSNAEAAADPVRVFSALGDPTRLALVRRLADGRPRSLTRLCQDAPLTRQAVTKHLRTLEAAGLVSAARAGRESLYVLHPEPVDAARAWLEHVTAQWDDALGRLKAHVEAGG